MLRRRVLSLKPMRMMTVGCDTSSSSVAVYRRQLVRRLPICNVQTNLSKSFVPTDFNQRLCKVLASTLNKPENMISISLTTDLKVTRGTCDSPTATVEVWSIGVFDTQRNVQYTEDVFKFLMEALNLPPNRITLMFHPLQKEDAAHLTYLELQKQT